MGKRERTRKIATGVGLDPTVPVLKRQKEDGP